MVQEGTRLSPVTQFSEFHRAGNPPAARSARSELRGGLYAREEALNCEEQYFQPITSHSCVVIRTSADLPRDSSEPLREWVMIVAKGEKNLRATLA